MPFGCFRRSIKSSYNLNHKYDTIKTIVDNYPGERTNVSPLFIESPSVFSENGSIIREQNNVFQYPQQNTESNSSPLEVKPKTSHSKDNNDVDNNNNEKITNGSEDSINETKHSQSGENIQIKPDIERCESKTSTTISNNTFTESEKNEMNVKRSVSTEKYSSKSSSLVDSSRTSSNSSLLYSTKNGRHSTDTVLSSTSSTQYRKRRSGIFTRKINYDEKHSGSITKYSKLPSEEEFIKNAIAKNDFLSKVITGRRLQDVIDAMYKKNVKAKERIIKEGTRGSHMYVVSEGEFEVSKRSTKGLVNIMKPGDVFGELAILYNAKRHATVKSSGAAVVWVIDSIVFHHIMKKSNVEEQDEIISFLRNVPILNEVGDEVLRKVAGLLKPEFFETNSAIVKEGDQGDKFYIITAGSVSVTREDDGFLNQLHKGQCFGEKSLLEDITRQATVTADAPGTECLTLTREQFINHFGKVEDISMLTMPPQLQIIIEEPIIKSEYAHLDLREFKILKTLGVGGFGRVEFVQHKTDPSLTFALKYLKKHEMVQQDQQHHVINEVKIQMACKSPFIINMYKIFRDNKYIYFLMEVCLGGDLWSLLQKQPNKRLDEKGAKFVAGCVLEALEYLHNRGIVYRDLKPENLLIDNNGYIKLTDFGFAKHLPPSAKSGTFAGTPEYVAPEIILNRGHDKAVDFWAFGIFIYELLDGKTPFRSSDPSYMRTYNKILDGFDVVTVPSHIYSKAKNLITKLLKKSPEERLGCLRGGIGEIKIHKWFGDFDWERLQQCKMSSPFKPKLSSNVDLRYITDIFRGDNDIPPDETSGWDDFL